MSDPTDEPTGPRRLTHQFELAMAVRAFGDDEPGLPDAVLAEILGDALRSDRLDRFVLRQASLANVVADVAGHIAGALLNNRAALEQALARLDAGTPLTPADIGLDGDSVLRVLGLNIQQAPPTTT